MPIITVDNAGNLSKNQKDELIRKLTDVVTEVTNKPSQYVYVKINEISHENFGIGGKSLG